MSTLLLRLAAPLQSWGLNAIFNIRQTDNVPSKSGVVGLLASALGRRREESVADLDALRFGVRVVRGGKLLCDYHTVSRNPNPRPALNKTDYVTKRYYLSDAVFIVGFESGDTAFLTALDAALREPAYPLFLGRRSCPPTPPLSLGVSEADLETALMGAQCPETVSGGISETQRLVLEAVEATPSTPLVKDQPLSFSPKRRLHGYRMICERYAEHDPFCELEA
ncbi:MAG: type I-E CRISPR-associated protein Cas5/CasD [bacterium]